MMVDGWTEKAKLFPLEEINLIITEVNQKFIKY